MSAIDEALARLRAAGPAARAGLDAGGPLAHGLQSAGVAFAAVGGSLEQRWDQALRELAQCIYPFAGETPTLSEGGVYHGAWIESTASIGTEVLSRFAPAVTESTHRLFAERQRPDGLMPYKVTAQGPAFSQIQIVTPLARSVWNHYLLTGGSRDYLRTMYDAMVAMDGWLAQHRDTRGTGGVEAFCTFDTGHDLSPRFWTVPDRCEGGDATRWDVGNPILPFVAPDLTANVACQRAYLGVIAQELGEDARPWVDAAEASLAALWEQCYHEGDGIFYDRDATGAHVRVQSDVLLRVLACEVGDDAFFTAALERYLMNTTKFFAGYGFTSIAMDDPRFDHDFSRNSWGGPSNALSLVRAPHAFEWHGRYAELAISAMPVVSALTRADRFPQCVDPWSGAAGFTDVYSPAILWFLDAIERHFGILPRPDGELWLSGLAPTRLEGGAAVDAMAYARSHQGVRYELAADDATVAVWRDGSAWLRFPRGWRVVLDAAGEVVAIVGLAPAPVAGTLELGAISVDLSLAANDRVEFRDGVAGIRTQAALVPPQF